MSKFSRVSIIVGIASIALVGSAVLLLAVTVGVNFGSVPDWLGVVGSVGTLIVAVVAAGFAFRQVEEARQLRMDQSRPFVVVDFEPNPTGMPHMDLVVQNVGSTLAKDVRIIFDPPLRTTLDDDPDMRENMRIPALAQAHLFSRVIPSIAPGKRYAVLFDDMVARFKRDDLPRSYRVTVEMSGPHGREESLEQILDLNLYYNTVIVTQHGTHHIAKTLRAWAKKNGVNSF